MSEDVRRAASVSIVQRVRGLGCLAAARTVLSYLPVGAEVDPGWPFADTANDRVRTLVPVGVSASDEPRWVAADHGDRAAPRDSALVARDLAYPVVALVPGVGFDRAGVRLGRGAGFYDRALAELRDAGPVHAIGLAFECQIVSSLPRDSWDQRVDLIASERCVVAPAVPGDPRSAATP